MTVLPIKGLLVHMSTW